jgi:PhnB protein
MTTVNPYLNFSGNCEEAFNFYLSAFGGEFSMLMRFKDVPAEHQMTESEAEKIMHVALPIGSGTVLMGSDRPDSMGPTTAGNNSYISINAASEEEAARLFRKLSAGGQVIMPLEKAFWGAYFGMFNDKFGIQWMVNYDYNQS